MRLKDQLKQQDIGNSVDKMFAPSTNTITDEIIKQADEVTTAIEEKEPDVKNSEVEPVDEQSVSNKDEIDVKIEKPKKEQKASKKTNSKKLAMLTEEQRETKTTRISLAVKPSTMEKLEKYIELTGSKGVNDFVSKLLDNLDQIFED